MAVLVSGVWWPTPVLNASRPASAGRLSPGTPDQEPAYVVRGRQTEARQRALHERFQHVRAALADAVREAAPDLIARLEPPDDTVSGYQLLPRIVDDPPAASPPRQLVSLSWPWSDTLLARLSDELQALEADLLATETDRRTTDALQGAERRRALEALAEKYGRLIAGLRTIAADVQYNWHWQERVATDRSTFDALQKRLDTALHGAVPDDTAPTAIVAPRDFFDVEEVAPGNWEIAVPVLTDIADTGFVDAFRQGMETLWQSRTGANTFRVRIDMRVVAPEDLCRAGGSCTPLPTRGDRIDVTAHVARFPRGAAVLTTGASTLRFEAERAIVLSPAQTSMRVLAHEFGHVLGLPDAYLRGYADIGADGFRIHELADPGDIMGAPGSGPVVPGHLTRILRARAAGYLNESLHMYEGHELRRAVDAARHALALHPEYGAAFNNLAAAHASLGEWDAAVAAAIEAVRLMPGSDLARGNLTWALRGRRQRDSRPRDGIQP